MRLLTLLVSVSIALSSCDIPTKPNKSIIKINNYINNSCLINNYSNTSKDIILATIYFENNKYKINYKDKLILNSTAKVYKSCNKKIIIIGHSSNKEHNQSHYLSYKLAYKRSKNVYLYLLKQQINRNQIYYISCDDSKNKYYESSSKASLGNQRVQVVMLSKSYVNSMLTCLKS